MVDTKQRVIKPPLTPGRAKNKDLLLSKALASKDSNKDISEEEGIDLNQ